MTSPFPGMNPYVESAELWSGFHQLLAGEIAGQLNARLSDKYYAETEVKIFVDAAGLAAPPPVHFTAALLKVDPRGPLPGGAPPARTAPVQRVALPAGPLKLRTVKIRLSDTLQTVTVVEILSPLDKYGRGRERYRRKRAWLLQTTVHLVEIDLLRSGRRPGWEVAEPALDTDYICLVNRAGYGQARVSDIWPVALNDPLPALPIPLLPPEPDILLDLDQARRRIWDEVDYERHIDYTQPPPPPTLRPPMQRWLEKKTVRRQPVAEN